MEVRTKMNKLQLLTLFSLNEGSSGFPCGRRGSILLFASVRSGAGLPGPPFPNSLGSSFPRTHPPQGFTPRKYLQSLIGACPLRGCAELRTAIAGRQAPTFRRFSYCSFALNSLRRTKAPAREMPNSRCHLTGALRGACGG